MIGLKDSRQFFSHWEAKPKPMAPCARDFSRALSKLQKIVRNCDWFIALFAPVVIGRSNCFGFGFSTGIWKPLYMLEWNKYCSLSHAPKSLVNHLHLAALTLKWSILSTAMLHDENMEKRSHSDSPEIFSGDNWHYLFLHKLTHNIWVKILSEKNYSTIAKRPNP